MSNIIKRVLWTVVAIVPIYFVTHNPDIICLTCFANIIGFLEGLWSRRCSNE